jgi:hypothetical protein
MVLLADLGLDVLLVFAGQNRLACSGEVVRSLGLLSVLCRGALLLLVVSFLDDHHLRTLVVAAGCVALGILRRLRLGTAIGRLTRRSSLRRSRRDVEPILESHLVDPLLEGVLEPTMFFRLHGRLVS